MKIEEAQGHETLDGDASEAIGEARFGFTANQKLGNAVARNRLRRRIKEVVRLVAPGRAKDGCDYVLIVRPDAATRPFAALQNDLIAALTAIHAPVHSSKSRSGSADRTQRAAPRNISTAGRT